MQHYYSVKEVIHDLELGDYVTYGIRMDHSLFVSDVSLDHAAIEDLVSEMNDGELDPVHFFDVINDFVASC